MYLNTILNFKYMVHLTEIIAIIHYSFAQTLLKESTEQFQLNKLL